LRRDDRRVQAGRPLSARILYGQASDLYVRARDAAAGPRSAQLADRFGAELGRIVSQHRDAGGTPLETAIKRPRTSMPHPFVFLERDGVEPTNNASERALRHVVVSRKISGQIKGGNKWMRHHEGRIRLLAGGSPGHSEGHAR